MRKWIIAAVAVLAIVAGVAAAAILIQQRQSREEQLASYYGVKLGSSKNEVGYVLGYPSAVQGPLRPDPQHKDWQISDELKVNESGDLEGTPSDPPGGSALKKFDEWHYDFPPDRVSVQFDQVKKTATSITCMQHEDRGDSKCRPILGATVGSSEAEVVKALGPPEHEGLDGVFKTMDYPSLGIQLMLTKSHVYLIRKSAPGDVNNPWRRRT